ncbi:MAG: ATP-binding protein [Geobacteraceae bacterium]|nr:ATP-binding protein [Geobacteraceae bacterium]
MLALLVGNSVRLIRNNLEEQVQARIIAVERAYATAVVLPLAARDYATLRDILDGMRTAQDIVYFAVTDPQNRILASSGWDSTRQLPAPGRQNNVRHIMLPVTSFGQEYGQVHYGLSTNRIDAAVHAVFSQSLMIALVEIFLSLILLSITCYLLTRNLSNLADASHQVADGNYDTVIPVRGRDEVAVLTENFNRMTTAVRERHAKVQFYQDELRQANQELETTLQKVRELTRLAEQATVAKREFLQNMSHELRTPMNGVLGMAQLLGFTSLNEEQQQYLASLESSADNLLTMISDILDFTALAGRQTQLVISGFQLHEVIGAIEQAARLNIGSKEITLKTLLEPQTQKIVYGDRQRIQQILHHLVSNAVKFTVHGEITIAVEVMDDDSKRMIVKFTVNDTGVGITPEQLETIFSPFNQADNSSTRQYGGAGLGLSMVKLMVELMDGQVGASSIQGGGSSFWFSIPLQLNSPFTIAF